MQQTFHPFTEKHESATQVTCGRYRFKRRQAVGLPCLLALLVPCLHADAGIRTGRVNHALIPGAQERTRLSACEDHDPTDVRLQLDQHPFGGHATVVRVGCNDPRFPEHVEFIGLDDQAPLATCAAFVAFESLHGARVSWMAYPVTVERFPLERGRLSGEEVTRLMRQFRVKIRDLSERTGITMKRIREVRTEGLADRNTIRDWIEAITGNDPGPM